jgi:hypothetical protein
VGEGERSKLWGSDEADFAAALGYTDMAVGMLMAMCDIDQRRARDLLDDDAADNGCDVSVVAGRMVGDQNQRSA